MAIIADVLLPRSEPIPNVYISPFRIAETASGGEYELSFKRGGKSGTELKEVGFDLRFVTFLGGSPRFKKGVAFDRLRPNREQVYDDLRAKLLGGELPEFTNVRNEDGTPFIPSDEPVRSHVGVEAADQPHGHDRLSQ